MADKQIIEQFNRDHGYVDHDVLFVRKLRERGLTDSQIAAVLVAIETTCHHCWDSGDNCQCWNDE